MTLTEHLDALVDQAILVGQEREANRQRKLDGLLQESDLRRQAQLQAGLAKQLAECRWRAGAEEGIG